ncbi:MAG: hypothetical protein QM758_14315 [Armatimonas sp.]
MTTRRAIFWSLFFATMPAVAYMSFDTVHVQEEFERYGVGAIPSSWWREPQPLQELDWRYRNDENWKTFRGLITKNDSVRAFRSPNRPWSSYDMLEGLMIIRQGRPIAHAILSEDRRRITNLILPGVATTRPTPGASASPEASASPKQVTQKNRDDK